MLDVVQHYLRCLEGSSVIIPWIRQQTRDPEPNSIKNVQEWEMQLLEFEPWPGPKQFLLLYPAAQMPGILAQMACCTFWPY
jgi:hypothetical protein